MSRSSHVAAEEAAPAFRGRASWSGLLRFSLVAVPVKAYPAVSTTEEVHLNQLPRLDNPDHFSTRPIST